MCGIQDAFQEPAPPCTQVSKAGLNCRSRERTNTSKSQENQETVYACPRIFEDRQATLSLQAVLLLELSPVYKTRKPLGLGVLCFPNDLPQLHPCAQTIASGTSRPGWLEELQSTQPVPAQTKAGSGGPVRTLGPAQTFAFHKPTWQQPRPSHYAVFFQFGVSWSGLCSCPAAPKMPGRLCIDQEPRRPSR